MQKGTNVNPVLEAFRDSYDKYDAWGSALNALFDIAECLHRNGAEVPGHWEFTPSPFVVVDTELDAESESFFAAQIDLLMRQGHYSNLVHAGNVLERFTHILELEGHSY